MPAWRASSSRPSRRFSATRMGSACGGGEEQGGGQGERLVGGGQVRQGRARHQDGQGLRVRDREGRQEAGGQGWHARRRLRHQDGQPLVVSGRVGGVRGREAAVGSQATLPRWPRGQACERPRAATYTRAHRPPTCGTMASASERCPHSSRSASSASSSGRAGSWRAKKATSLDEANSVSRSPALRCSAKPAGVDGESQGGGKVGKRSGSEQAGGRLGRRTGLEAGGAGGACPVPSSA